MPVSLQKEKYYENVRKKGSVRKKRKVKRGNSQPWAGAIDLFIFLTRK